MRIGSFVSNAVWAGLLAIAISPAAPGAEQETWDGLVQVEARKVQTAYLLPGADFRDYTKVIIDPPVVEFRKNWPRSLNRSIASPSRQLSPSDVEAIRTAFAEGFQQILAAGFAKGGWEVGVAEGPDVLRVTPVLLNVYINAPDTMSAGRSTTYAVEAGEATLALEVRDAETGQLMGRAVDRRRAGRRDSIPMVRNRVTNRADFEQLLKAWTTVLVEGLGALKDASPVAPAKSAR
jgi:hypothetical protein